MSQDNPKRVGDNSFDVFISYRRKDGWDYARILQSELEKRGYDVFLDDDDLENSPFYGGVFQTIERSAVFLAILTPGFFENARNEDDWILSEVKYAISSHRTICLINPDNLFSVFPDNIPQTIKDTLAVQPQWVVDYSGCLLKSINRLDDDLRQVIKKTDKRSAPVFVSYTRADKDIVFPFVAQLEKELHIRCWIDLSGIETGDQFEDVIMEAIDTSTIVLFMLSDHSLKSDWTRREVFYAHNMRKRVLPIVIDGKGLRGWFLFHFGNIDFIDITSEEQRSKLSMNLRGWLGITLSFTGMANNHKWVDLGTGVKWSVVNLGAESLEDSGEFFAWGETAPKTEYSWLTYKFGNSPDQLAKYVPDGLSTLDECDDAVRKAWGSPWRIPTKNEFLLLLESCEKVWASHNGCYGWRFTSKINGESIFFPAAGYINDSLASGKGSIGRYWTSSVDEKDPGFAWSLFFNSITVNRLFGYRCSGLVIRPVAD